MSEPSLALQRALFAALAATAPLTALIGQRIYDRVPASSIFPYIRFGGDQITSENQDCVTEAVEVTTQIDVFSRAPGKVELKTISGIVFRALNNRALDLGDEYELLSLQHDSTRTLDDPDGLTTHAILTFRALIDSVA